MSMIARQRASASEPTGGRGRHTARRWLRAWAAVPVLLLTVGSASADIFSDAWDAAKSPFETGYNLGVEALEELAPLNLGDLIVPKGCSFHWVSGKEFSNYGDYRFSGACQWHQESTKDVFGPDKQVKSDVTIEMDVQGLWSQDAKLASEIIKATRGGKPAFAAMVSYACGANPWATGQSCQKTQCTTAGAKGCDALAVVLERAGYSQQPLTRQVFELLKWLKVKITAPKAGEVVSGAKSLGITIVLPVGYKMQYELTSPTGPAYSQILGPVYSWGKFYETSYVVASVPVTVLKTPGQWTLAAHLIGGLPGGIDPSATKDQLTFKVVQAVSMGPPGAGPPGAVVQGKLGTPPTKTPPGPGGGASQGAAGSPVTPAQPPSAGGPAPSLAAPPGPLASLPPPGIMAGPAGGLRLTAARQQGPADLLLAFQNAGGDSPSQAVELRLGGRAIGQGRLPGLAAQQQAQVVVHFELPPGGRGPVDLEVWVGSDRVGSARVTPVVRGR